MLELEIQQRNFLATTQITVLEYPAYLPDLAPPSDFYLFPKIKEILKGSHFDDTDDIRSIQRQLWRSLHKTSFKIALKGGLGAGTRA